MWPRLGCALVVLPMLAGCVSTASVGDQALNPLSGILLGTDDLTRRSVEDDALPALPPSAPAYTVVFPTAGDLQRLAEAHAGGPVEPAASPLSQGRTPSFTTGDGWFTMTPGQESDSYAADRLGWSWLEQAWFEAGQSSGPLIDCPPASDVDAVAQQFFAHLGLDVVLDGARRCTATTTWLGLDLLLEGLPVVGVNVEATVDSAGTVVSASGPLLVVRPLAEVTLAPANELRRRLVAGPGFLSMYYPCQDCAWAVDSERPLGLALTTDGGLGQHDHIPGGVAPGQPRQFLVPALSVTATVTWQGNSQVVSRGVVAVSSAELVADPAEAGTAQLADVHADPANATCVGENEYDVGLCASRLATTVDIPVLLTVDGEVYVPIGAQGCDPVLRLDFGDGTEPRTFTPRAGTLVTARVAHRFTEPGTYDVTAYSASQCAEPGSGGAGEETEYEYQQTLRVSVDG